LSETLHAIGLGQDAVFNTMVNVQGATSSIFPAQTHPASIQFSHNRATVSSEVSRLSL
jgi:hypothetical protein